MSDVRSLLRSELASRKGPSQPGKTAPNRVTKKRKVDAGDDLTHKRMRHALAAADQQVADTQAVQPPSTQAFEEIEEAQELETESVVPEALSESTVEKRLESAPLTTENENESALSRQAVDEDEWAAFEREVAAPTRVSQAPAAVAATATISAAPISAEEIAAQQEKANQSMVRAREAEAEGEREDAARFLEDEFDEMEQLEERVRRLKEKREQLRNKQALEDAEEHHMDKSDPVLKGQRDNDPKVGPADENDDDDDDDEDDDWDNWRFR